MVSDAPPPKMMNHHIDQRLLWMQTVLYRGSMILRHFAILSHSSINEQHVHWISCRPPQKTTRAHLDTLLMTKGATITKQKKYITNEIPREMLAATLRMNIFAPAQVTRGSRKRAG